MKNNKGMTLVELLVTFSLLLIIVVGLYNLILEVKFEIDDREIVKDIVEYSSLINNDIHYNLLIDKPFAIAIKEKSSSSWTCFATGNNTCEKTEDGQSISVTYNETKNNAPQISKLNNLCKEIFPCSYYFYIDSTDRISYKIIALNKDNPKYTKGVLYGSVFPEDKAIFESVPNDEFIEIRDKNLTVKDDEVTTIKENKPSIEFSNNVLIINYGLYIIDDDQNYGFKIAYPFS